MKIKFLSLLLITFLLLVVYSVTVSGGYDIIAPTAGSYNSGATLFNITVLDIGFAANVTWYYNASGVDVWTEIGTCTNDATNNVSIACSLTLTSGMDGYSWSLNATIRNSTIQGNDADEANVTTDSAHTVNFDSTDPVLGTIKCAPKVIDWMGRIGCESDCADNLDSLPTRTRTLTKPSGDTTTTTETPHDFIGGDTNELGIFTYSFRCTDDAGNSVGNNDTFTVDSDVDAEVLKELEEKEKKVGILDTKIIIAIIGAVFIVLVFIILGVVESNKRKRKRKR